MLQEDAMSQELAKLTEENASLQSKLANTARSHAASTHELGRVKADLEGMAADRDKSAKELKAARMRIDDLSSQVRKTRAPRSALPTCTRAIRLPRSLLSLSLSLSHYD